MLINLALCFYSKTMLKCYIQVYAADTSTVVLVILDPSRFQPFSQYQSVNGNCWNYEEKKVETVTLLALRYL